MKVWSDERIEHLKTRWAQGVSGTEIARELHTTRNSILGKVDRLGLSGRVKKVKSARSGPRRRSASLNAMLVRREARAALPPPAEPGTERADLPPDQSTFAVPLVETKDHHCRWPLTAPTHEMLVCGAPMVSKPYCARHARIAYVGRGR